MNAVAASVAHAALPSGLRVRDLLPEPILIIDSKGVLIDFNQAAARQLPALQRGECLGPRVGGESQLHDALKHWLRCGNLLRSLLRLQGNDGSEYLLSGARLRDPVQQRTAILLRCERRNCVVANFLSLSQQVERLSRELRQRERLEASLHAEKERAQVTLEAIGDAVITCDALGMVEYLNPAAESLTGWPRELAVNKPLRQVFLVMDGETRQPLDLQPAAVTRAKLAEGSEPSIVIVQRGGQEFYVDYSIEPIHARSGALIGAVVVCRDISETHRLSQQLRHQANHDALTGLANRREFERQVDRLRRSARSGEPHWLLFVDLDHFKRVNDTSGHAAGDELLRRLSERLQGLIRHSDLLARIGGDEFAVLLADCPEPVARELADGLRRSVQEFDFNWGGCSHRVGASVGLIGFRGASADGAELMAAADRACYAAKQAGRDQVHVGSLQPCAVSTSNGQTVILQALREALAGNRIELYGQPLLAIGHTEALPAQQSIEVLARLPMGDGELQPPSAFLSSARRHGLAPTLDGWVLQRVWQQLAEHPNWALHINLCEESLLDERFVDALLQRLGSDRLRAARLCLEVPDAALATHPGRLMPLIRRAMAAGARVAIDGFRGGLGSIDALRRLPVNLLKLDRSLVSRIARDRVDRSVVAALAQIGESLGVDCVACGVESQRELDLLHATAVRWVQGHFTGRPRPLTAFTN